MQKREGEDTPGARRLAAAARRQQQRSQHIRTTAKRSVAPHRVAADDPAPYATAPRAVCATQEQHPAVRKPVADGPRLAGLGRRWPKRMGAAPISIGLADHDFACGNAQVSALIIIRVSDPYEFAIICSKKIQGDTDNESFA